MHVGTTFGGEFAHHGAIAKTAQVASAINHLSASIKARAGAVSYVRRAQLGGPAALACGGLGGPVGVSQPQRRPASSTSSPLGGAGRCEFPWDADRLPLQAVS